MHYILAITVDHYHPSSSSSWSSLEVQCSGSKRCKAKLFLLPRLLSQPLITITMTFEIDSPLSPFRAPLLFFFFFLTLFSFPLSSLSLLSISLFCLFSLFSCSPLFSFFQTPSLFFSNQIKSDWKAWTWEEIIFNLWTLLRASMIENISYHILIIDFHVRLKFANLKVGHEMSNKLLIPVWKLDQSSVVFLFCTGL